MQRFRQDWWGVVALVLATYLVIHLVLVPSGGGFVITYVIVPLMWTFVALAIWRMPRQRPAAKSSVRAALVFLAFGFALLQVFISAFGGIFYGFGESPYSFAPRIIVQNLFYMGTALVGMELSRAWILNHRYAARLNLTLRLMFVAVLYGFISIPLAAVTRAGADLDTLQWVNSDFLPAMAESMLASYLAYAGGWVPALVYRGLLQSFLWFCPILPDPGWVVEGIMGTAIPVAGLILAEKMIAGQHIRVPRARVQPKRRGRRVPIGWAVTAGIIVLIVLFSAGAFGFKPTVIVSGSMQPELDIGDIVLVKHADVNNIEVDDVIKYRDRDGTSVIHRVIGITQESGQPVFKTKGDDNDEPDREPVLAHQVQGRVAGKIPKVGWISIGMKEFLRR